MKKMLENFDSAIDETFLADELAVQVPTKKFLQSNFQSISDKVVLRALNSQKFLICREGLSPKIDDFVFSTDERSKKYSFDSDYDMCQADVRFYASLNSSNKVEIYAIHTFKNSYDCFSISEYLIPNGKFDDAVLIARICSHGKNGQIHINWNGEEMPAGEAHLHIMTEYFQKLEQDRAEGNLEYLASRMAFPDGVKLGKIENIAVCASRAETFFNLAPSEFAISLETEDKKTFASVQSQLKELKNQYEKSPESKKFERVPIKLPSLNEHNMFMKSSKAKKCELVFE